MLTQVRIVGSGLIGTSIALGLCAHGIRCQMIDSDPAAERLANDLTGREKTASPELVIFALPSHAIPQVIEAEFALNPKSTFMDVGSVKNEPLLYVKASSLSLERFVPTHPMAGREIGGAAAARGDLFATRSWVITPDASCSKESIALVIELIELLGASVIELPADEHDRAVAAISHLPQITASLLAQSLNSTPSNWLELAGAGVRDTTRIAASDPGLWSEIIYSNRTEIAPLAKKMHEVLGELIAELDDKAAIAQFIDRGGLGRARIPGKHGGKARAYAYLPIVIDDKPGQLAAIFNECKSISVNVEDLTIEHSPGQLSALITLALSLADAQLLSDHLSAIGWNVHPILN